jgi:hypothetical protein
MLERYLIPLAPYVLVAAASIVCLILFGSLEKEVRRLKLRLQDHARSGGSAEDLGLKLADLSARIHDIEERGGIMATPLSLKPSLNLNKRTQVLRMSRRGEPAANIAASLSVPRREVELLLKIYGLTLNSSNEITS